MMKWIALAAGVFLFFNGMTARTYGYENPANYCFQMDYIKLVGCFGSSAGPTLITWGATLIGAGLIAWSVLRSRRKAV